MYSELFLLRLAVGVIFIFHAVPKLRDSNKMAGAMGWMPGQILGLGLVEFISAIGLIGGLAVRFSALLLSAVMVGAIYHKMKKWHVPFMSPTTTGWEFDFMILAATLTIYLR
jgi:uncharacterized membrane protein YphA (DoxX/SURF4 family)